MRHNVHAHSVLVTIAKILGRVVDVAGIVLDAELPRGGSEMCVTSNCAFYLRSCISSC